MNVLLATVYHCRFATSLERYCRFQTSVLKTWFTEW